MKLFRACRWGMAVFFLAVVCDHVPTFAVAKKADASSEKDSSTSKKKGGGEYTHVVKRGETLWGIARKYEVSVGEMMDLNHMQNDKVHEGQVLKIPQASDEVPGLPPPPPTHVVEKGETFRSIAKAKGISQDELEHANPKVDPDHPKAGTKLKLPVHPDAPEKEAASKERSTPASNKYVVREQDTYYSIAKAHGLTSKAIAKANPDVNPDRLRPGSSIVLPAAPAKQTDADSSDKPRKTDEDRPKKKEKDSTVDGEDKPAKPAGTHSYTISRGESPESIAEAFGITLKRLCAINGKSSADSLKAGSEIQVPDR